MRANRDTPLTYSANQLDRCDAARTDTDVVAELLSRPDAHLTLVWRSQSLVTLGESPGAHFAHAARVVGRVGPDAPVLLGMKDGVPYFAVDVSDLEDPI